MSERHHSNALSNSGQTMSASLVESNGHRLLVLSAGGQVLGRVQEVTDLIGQALTQRAAVIVAPIERLDPAFFQLRSGLAGEVVQKIVNYRLKLAVIGDFSAHIAASSPWRDFVKEANRGGSIFFLPDLEALAARLSSPDSAEDREG